MISLEQIRVNSAYRIQEGLILEDEKAADHNRLVLDTFIDKLHHDRHLAHLKNRWALLADIPVNLGNNYGRVYVAPGTWKWRPDDYGKPLDVQPRWIFDGNLQLTLVNSEGWKGLAAVEFNIRANFKGCINVATDGKALPAIGFLWRQEHRSGSDRQPWGHYHLVEFNGKAEEHAALILSAEELTFNELETNNDGPGAGTSILFKDDKWRDPKTMATMTNVEIRYLRSKTMSGRSPLEIGGGPYGTAGDIIIGNCLLNAHSAGGKRPYVRILEGIDQYRLWIRGRCEQDQGGPQDIGRNAIQVDGSSRLLGLYEWMTCYDKKGKVTEGTVLPPQPIRGVPNATGV